MSIIYCQAFSLVSLLAYDKYFHDGQHGNVHAKQCAIKSKSRFEIFLLEENRQVNPTIFFKIIIHFFLRRVHPLNKDKSLDL